MPNSPNQGKLLFESSNCEVSQGKILAINPLEAKNVTKPCSPNSLDVLACKNPLRSVAEAEVNGLNPSTVSPKFAVPHSLVPKFIPVLDRGLLKMPGLLPRYALVAISLDDIFLKAPVLNGGHVTAPNIDTMNPALLQSPGLAGKKILLLSTGPDKLIESIWQYANPINFYKQVGQLGVAVATAFNFSVFLNECPFAQHLNEKKSLLTFREYQDHGIPCIPHLYWGNDWQIEDWIQWFEEHPEVEIITINCQCYKSDFDRKFAVTGIKKILVRLPQLHILLEGGVRLLPELLDFQDRLHIAAKQPAMEALAHQKLLIIRGELRSIYNSVTSIADLTTKNFEVYEEYLAKKYGFGRSATPEYKRLPVQSIRTKPAEFQI
jgi:hypothetical protein